MKLGIPDNPNSKAGHLFRPSNYLLAYHGGLKPKLDILAGATIEEHFQLPEEVELDSTGYTRIEEHVKLARNNGMNVMMHSPFLFDKNEGTKTAFNMDFLWLELASAFRPISIGNGIEIGQRRMDDETLHRTLELSDRLQIPYVTFHFTKPGVFYTEEELVKYEKRIEHMQKLIHENGYCTIPCLETGGIDPVNHERIARNQGVMINLDTMHLMLDLQLLMPDKDFATPLEADTVRDQRLLRFYHDCNDLIANFHFTQTVKGNDLHKGIFEPGFSRANELILQELDSEMRSGARKELFAMVESAFDIRNFIYLDSLLRGDLVQRFSADNKYATLFIGLPATGCSESMAACKELWSTIFAESDMGYAIDSDMVKMDYFNNPHGAIDISDDRLFPLEFRRQMYEKVYYSTIAQRLRQNMGFAFSASFNKREFRDLYYQLFDLQSVKDVYIVYHFASDDDVRKRLESRQRAKNAGSGPTFVMSDFETYKKMGEEGNVFIPNEVAGRKNYHVIMYNTSTQEMTLHNKDSRLENIAYVLRSNAKAKFGKG